MQLLFYRTIIILNKIKNIFIFKKKSNEVFLLNNIIQIYPTIKNIYDYKKYHSEKLCLSQYIDNNALYCINCDTKMNNPSHNDKWSCKHCNLAYSAYGNSLYMHHNSLKTKYSCQHIKPNTKININSNKVDSFYSRQIFKKYIPSKILPNFQLEVFVFKCHFCNIEYESFSCHEKLKCRSCNF
jgi:hypothetical protein